jgi:kinesin family protein C2/C3
MENSFPSLLMESWSPGQGVSPDTVVCAGSPDMELDSEAFSFNANAASMEQQSLTQAMFPEVSPSSAAEGWSEILLNTPLAKEDEKKPQIDSEAIELPESGVESQTLGSIAIPCSEACDLYDSPSDACNVGGNPSSDTCNVGSNPSSDTCNVGGNPSSDTCNVGGNPSSDTFNVGDDGGQSDDNDMDFENLDGDQSDHNHMDFENLDGDQSDHNGMDFENPDGNQSDDVDMDFENPDDTTLCYRHLKLVTGYQNIEMPKEDAVMCINAGDQQPLGSAFQQDLYYVGGDVLRTDETIVEKEGSSVYQTARFGNFSYIISDLPAGDYFVDLHFAEIVFTNGPAGMRVFDVFIQEDKILSELDIYARVGSNTPLVLMDAPAHVLDGGTLTLRFEAVTGSPIVCAICIRKAQSLGRKGHKNPIIIVEDDLKQTNQDQELAVVEEGYNQKSKGRSCKSVVEYEKKIEELRKDYELKKKECHEAWMSLEDSNRQLEKLRNELMRKSLHVGSLAHAVEGQVNELRDLQDQHEREKKLWALSVNQLNDKIKVLKSEYVKLLDEANCYASALPDISEMTSSVQALVNQHEDLKVQYTELKTKFVEESKERKQLYNKLLELKGNIRVFCRCRPLSAQEVAEGAVSVAEFDTAKDSEISIRTNGAPKKVFKFDSVFTPEDDQVDVFADTAPVVVSVLDGYNVCIFAYGQTGTGKTFTMEGTEENRGVNYRTLEELFRVANERKGQFKYDISVSVLEVYNEQIRDLLASPQPGQTVKKLEIKQMAEGIHHVPGLVEAQVHSMNEVWEVLQTGSSARAVGSTNANEHSSRSHCILYVMVRGENSINGECTRSKLWLVDLAGSERVAKTDVQGDRLKEAQNINKSLSALGDVISSLATKNSHIPFRNSKLTHLLQDSLGGDSKTLMFVQISPNENDISETLCSLNFASRVRGIELGPARKQFDSTELLKYKQMVEKAKQDGKSKEGSMKKMEETIQNLEAKLKGRDQANKLLHDKVKELEGQLANERKARLNLESKLKEQQQQAGKVSEKPPLIRQFGGVRTVNETNVLSKDLVNLSDALTENKQMLNAMECNGKPQEGEFPLKNGLIDPYSKGQKENKSELYDDQNVKPIPRKTGRASMCTTARRTSIVPLAARRLTMVPLPVTRNEGILDVNTSSSQTNEDEQANNKESFTANSKEPVTASSKEPSTANKAPVLLPTATPVSLRGLRNSNTLNKLRQSINKKVHFNSPLLKGPNDGTSTAAPSSTSGGQKLPPIDTTRIRRVSSTRAWGRISGTGNISAQRVLCANRGGIKPTVQLREKERGWNR